MYQALSDKVGNIKLLPPAIRKPVTCWSGKQIISTVLINIVPEGQYPVNLCSTAKIADKVYRIIQMIVNVTAIIIVRFEGLAVVTNSIVFWVVTSYSLIEIHLFFRRNCCLHLLACIVLQDADFYHTVWCHIPENGILEPLFCK